MLQLSARVPSPSPGHPLFSFHSFSYLAVVLSHPLVSAYFPYAFALVASSSSSSPIFYDKYPLLNRTYNPENVFQSISLNGCEPANYLQYTRVCRCTSHHAINLHSMPQTAFIQRSPRGSRNSATTYKISTHLCLVTIITPDTASYGGMFSVSKPCTKP